MKKKNRKQQQQQKAKAIPAPAPASPVHTFRRNDRVLTTFLSSKKSLLSHIHTHTHTHTHKHIPPSFTPLQVSLRRSQLAKMRALLFYQEQKHKRVKKIKSKLYRKIKRKAREKHEKERREQLHATNPELARQMDEEDAKERALERFSLRHKNMSRWAKTALKHGQVHAPGTKEAIEESLRIGQELKRKMQARKNADDSSGSDSYFDGSDSDDSDGDDEEDGGIVFREDLTSSSARSKSKSSGTAKARKLLAQIESDQSDEKAGALLSQKKGLMSLKFMQNAVSRQRENARAEALGLLAELEEDGGERVDDRTEAERNSDESDSIRRAKTTSGNAAGRRQMGSESSTTMSAKTKGKRNGSDQDMSTSSKAKTKSSSSVLKSGVAFSAGVRTQMSGAVEIASSEIHLKPSGEEIEMKLKKTMRAEKERVLETEESWGGAADAWNGDDDAWSSIPKVKRKEQGRENEKMKQKQNGGEDEVQGEASASDMSDSEADEEDPAVVLDAQSMSYRELQGELKKRGQKASGKKTALVKALEKVLEKEASEKLNEKKTKRKKKDVSKDAAPVAAAEDQSDDDDDDDDAGGWLSQPAAESSTSPSKGAAGNKSSKASKKGSAKLDVGAAISSVSSSTVADSTSTSGNREKGKSETARQKELVQMAFAVDNDAEADFAAEKAEVIGEHANGGKKPEPVLAGWGSWTGAGALQSFPGSKKKGRGRKGGNWGSKANSKRKRGGAGLKPQVPAKRRDTNLKHVIINEKRNKRAAKFLVKQAPHQFDTREQYERSIRNPVGPEWNTSDSHARMTRPKMIVRGGNVIAPIKMPSMYKRKLSTINREFEAAQKAKRAKRVQNRNFKQ